MKTNYDDIINTEYPKKNQNPERTRMDLKHRAKIFLPFAALKGFEQEIEQRQLAKIEKMNDTSGKIKFEEDQVYMKSILIKDTTKEEREQIVRESLGDEYSTGCGFESCGIDYQLYIDGKKELRDLNMEANCGFEVAHPEERKNGCSML